MNLYECCDLTKKVYLNHIYPETRQIYLINKDKALKLGGITKGNVLVSFYGIKLLQTHVGIIPHKVWFWFLKVYFGFTKKNVFFLNNAKLA